MFSEVPTARRPFRCPVELPQINHDKLKILCSECDPPNLVDPSSAQSRGASAAAFRIQAKVSWSFLLPPQSREGWTRSLYPGKPRVQAAVSVDCEYCHTLKSPETTK